MDLSSVHTHVVFTTYGVAGYYKGESNISSPIHWPALGYGQLRDIWVEIDNLVTSRPTHNSWRECQCISQERNALPRGFHVGTNVRFHQGYQTIPYLSLPSSPQGFHCTFLTPEYVHDKGHVRYCPVRKSGFLKKNRRTARLD